MRLNVNIPRAVSEFESAMRRFAIRRIIYKIIFRGKGLEFDTYRNYSPDDDAEFIDWKASKRADKLLVKQYIEERDLKIFFVFDMSDNMLMGSTEKLKCEYAAEVVAALAHLIAVSGDRVGFVLLGGDKNIKQVALTMPGLKRFNVFTDIITNSLNYGGDFDYSASVEFLINYMNPDTSAVFFVSDFTNLSRDSIKIMTSLCYKFETVGLMIRDPLDENMPDLDEDVVIENPRTGKQMIINPLLARKRYHEYAVGHETMVKKMFEDAGADFLKLRTDKNFVPDLASFLKERLRKKKFVMPGRRS